MSEKTYSRSEFDAAVDAERAETSAELRAAQEAAVQATFAEAAAAARAEGALAERERFKAVLTSAEARGRESTARHLLSATDMDADQVKGVLADIPRDAPAASLPHHGLWLGSETPTKINRENR